MEYAIIDLGGHQVWVEKNQPICTNRLNLPIGSNVSFNRILLVKKNGILYFGSPYLESAKVEGEISQHVQGSKLLVYKMKSKKKYRRKKGHRQQITKLVIKNIEI